MKSAAARPNAPHLNDEDLWARVQSGDEAAFEVFFRRHRGLAVQVARRICGDGAEDAVQAAFLSTWRNRASFDPGKGCVRSWLMGAVRNRSIDVVRKTNRRKLEVPAGEAVIEVEDPTRTDEVVFGRATARALRAAIAKLPTRQRQVVELGYVSELSQTEIARTLGLPLGTVKGRRRAALEQLTATAI